MTVAVRFLRASARYIGRRAMAKVFFMRVLLLILGRLLRSAASS